MHTLWCIQWGVTHTKQDKLMRRMKGGWKKVSTSDRMSIPLIGCTMCVHVWVDTWAFLSLTIDLSFRLLMCVILLPRRMQSSSLSRCSQKQIRRSKAKSRTCSTRVTESGHQDREEKKRLKDVSWLQSAIRVLVFFSLLNIYSSSFCEEREKESVREEDIRRLMHSGHHIVVGRINSRGSVIFALLSSYPPSSSARTGMKANVRTEFHIFLSPEETTGKTEQNNTRMWDWIPEYRL